MKHNRCIGDLVCIDHCSILAKCRQKLKLYMVDKVAKFVRRSEVV